MKKSLGIVLLAVIALSGCAAAGDDGVASAERQIQEAAPSATPEAAPIPADTAVPEPTANPTKNPYMGDYTEDEFYLLVFKPAWRGTLPTDEQLIGAGLLYCEQRRAGTPPEDIRVVEGEGEDVDWNNQQIASAALQTYCYDLYYS
jgi:hypothetical protein